MVVLLSDYRNFLLPPSEVSISKGDVKSLFSVHEFIETKSEDTAAYQNLVNTQMFADFISRRALAGTDSGSIMFFDSCLDAYKKVGARGG
jgi:hypothetical protein